MNSGDTSASYPALVAHSQRRVVRSTGAVMLPMIIMIVSLLLVRFPVAYVLLYRYRADAIWWSFPVSSALAAFLGALYYRFGGWRAARMLPVSLTAANSGA